MDDNRYRCIHAVVSGRVQGVFFRKYTQEKGEQLGLAGWVKNRPDGTVETEFTGPAGQVDEMLQWLHHGSPQARVDRVDSTEKESGAMQGGFGVRY